MDNKKVLELLTKLRVSDFEAYKRTLALVTSHRKYESKMLKLAEKDMDRLRYIPLF